MRLRIKTRWLPLLLLFAYSINGKAFTQGSPCITTPIPSCVTEVINNGLTWLRNNQDAETGSWDPFAPSNDTPPRRFGVATASMAVIVFLENGISPSDDVVCDALNYILSQVNMTTIPPGAIYQPVPITSLDDDYKNHKVYQTSLAVIALVEAEKQCVNECELTLPSGLTLHQVIQNAVNYLVNSQFPAPPNHRGGFGYISMGDYGAAANPHYKRPDISNTQFALWALCIAKGAGYNVPDNVWTNALDFVLSLQQPSGGFGYRPGFSGYPPYLFENGNRTAAALMSLWFIRCFIGSMTSPNGNTITDIDNAATNALTWWQNNYTYCNMPGNTGDSRSCTGDGYYYYVLSAARAFHYWGSLTTPPGPSYATDLGIVTYTGTLVPSVASMPCLCPSTTSPPTHLNPADYPCDFSSISAVWYKDFASQLRAIQNGDGSWSVITGGWDGGTTVATLFALLALSRANLPPSMTSDHIRPIVDWTTPCDCECVCCDTCLPDYPIPFYICAHIQDGCCSEGIDPASIHVRINLDCCPDASFLPTPTWVPDDPSGTSGTVIIQVRCDSLCDPKATFGCPYDSSFKVSVCLWAKDNAGNPLFPNPYTWEFTIDKDSPWVEMYYPLCLTCEDTTPHIIWPQDTCCGKHLWDGYFRFVTYHPCNLNCDTITISYHTPPGSLIVTKTLTPEDDGITYKESFCTGELDSIEVDVVEALDLPWNTRPGPYYPPIQVVDVCFDELKICLQVCDHALDISRFNWYDSTCIPDTVVCHKDTCCWIFHNVRIHRERRWEPEPVPKPVPGPGEEIRKKGRSMLNRREDSETIANVSRKRGCGCGKRRK